jgi:hypothetical protein
MTDHLPHVAATATLLTRLLAPAGVVLDDAHVVDLAASSRPIARTHSHEVRWHAAGWGPMLETQRRMFAVPIDPTLDPETSARLGVDLARATIDQQLELAALARSAGIEAPIGVADRRRIDHLHVDRDAFAALVSLRGRDDLAEWIADQFEIRHRLALDKEDELDLDSDLEFKGLTMVIPLLFDPLRIGRGYGDPGVRRRDLPEGAVLERHPPSWHDAEMLVDGAFPDVVLAAAVGRPFEAVYPGTPVGHRPIASVSHASFSTVSITTFHLEPDRVRLADVLEPPPRGA